MEKHHKHKFTASAGSEIYGAAVLDACEQIKTRMEPIASKHNFSSFAQVRSSTYSYKQVLEYAIFAYMGDICFLLLKLTDERVEESRFFMFKTM